MTEADLEQIADLMEAAEPGTLVDFGRNDAGRVANTDPVPIAWR
jgi:anthranilate/para-aminobenzoate synthase component I